MIPAERLDGFFGHYHGLAKHELHAIQLPRDHNAGEKIGNHASGLNFINEFFFVRRYVEASGTPHFGVTERRDDSAKIIGTDANISIGKAKTAVMFKKPTRFFEELINSSGKGRTVMTALENFTPLIGGIPITVDGQIVGGVGVSGAATADQDEQLAISGSKAFETAMSNDPTPAVSYWERSKVDDAFSKGAVLFDGSDGRNYMVHASRREKPGQAEIHTKDADVIYVLQGSATFITGGEAIDAKTTEPNELRGSGIKGGETRKIAKGDVIIVPHGVPHQFLEVTDPFLYFVVKVR